MLLGEKLIVSGMLAFAFIFIWLAGHSIGNDEAVREHEEMLRRQAKAQKTHDLKK